jgi:DNA-binding MarR family transcriptional regulator
MTEHCLLSFCRALEDSKFRRHPSWPACHWLVFQTGKYFFGEGPRFAQNCQWQLVKAPPAGRTMPPCWARQDAPDRNQKHFAKSNYMNETFITHQGDKEFQVLQNISRGDKIRQRDIAVIAGMSLGMTNAIVKRLVKKGLLIVRKINNRKIMYAVSPMGMEEIARKSYKYFKRTVRNIVYYKNSIDGLIREVKDAGFSSVFLVGQSDVDFIVEHFCGKYNIAYGREEDEARVPKGSFILYSENAVSEKPAEQNTGSLRDILVQI